MIFIFRHKARERIVSLGEKFEIDITSEQRIRDNAMVDGFCVKILDSSRREVENLWVEDKAMIFTPLRSGLAKDAPVTFEIKTENGRYICTAMSCNA